jgi:hypothetical protein
VVSRRKATILFGLPEGTNMVNEKIVEFPNPPEETLQHRAFKEATRLANLTPGEWKLWIDGRAQAIGIPVETLTQSVLDILKDRDKNAKEAKADTRRQEALAERVSVRSSSSHRQRGRAEGQREIQGPGIDCEAAARCP